MAAPNLFTGVELDRAGTQRRDAAWVQTHLLDRRSRALPFTRDGVLVSGSGEPKPVKLPLEQIPGGTGATVLLGIEPDGAALFAVDVDLIHSRKPLAPGARPLDLRTAGALLPRAVGGLIAYATALLNWHRSHTHCARCGAVTEAVDAGHLRRCPVCRAEHHPRTDPVVIMLVVDDRRDRVLLGRQPTWPAGRYSALAGYVEAGESLEEAVVREVAEEAGVAVAASTYHSSQPWPFPSALMIGFFATFLDGEPTAADGELEAVRWFSRSEVAAAAADGASATWSGAPGRSGPTLALPPPLAIARQLIAGWLAAPPRGPGSGPAA